MSKLDEVKKKIDDKMAEKPEVEKEPEEEEKDKVNVFSPFAKKIYADIKLYKAKLGDSHPTRAVSTTFRNQIEDKLEAGKEKDRMIEFFNSQFRLPGISQKAYSYFSENVIDPKAGDNHKAYLEKSLKFWKDMLVKRGSDPDWKKMIDWNIEFLSGKKESTLSDNKI